MESGDALQSVKEGLCDGMSKRDGCRDGMEGWMDRWMDVLNGMNEWLQR